MKKNKKENSSWLTRLIDVAEYRKMYNTLENKYTTLNDNYVALLENKVKDFEEKESLREMVKNERAKRNKLKRELSKTKANKK